MKRAIGVRTIASAHCPRRPHHRRAPDAAMDRLPKPQRQDLCRRRRSLSYAGDVRPPLHQGLTTNPSLMRKAGIADYRAFAREVLAEISDKPVCFEVLADDESEMERQALEIAGWADNVYVRFRDQHTAAQLPAG